MDKQIDLVGQRFNKWTILRDMGRNPEGRRVVARCDCGAEHTRFFNSIKFGSSPSCHKCASQGRKLTKPRCDKGMKREQPQWIDAVVKFKPKKIVGSVWEVAFGNNE